MNWNVVIIVGIAMFVAIGTFAGKEYAAERGVYGPNARPTALWRWFRRRYFGVDLGGKGPGDQDPEV